MQAEAARRCSALLIAIGPMVAHLPRRKIFTRVASSRRKGMMHHHPDLSQGQDEFYFALPYIERLIWRYRRSTTAARKAESGRALGIGEQKAQFVYDDIVVKRRTTA